MVAGQGGSRPEQDEPFEDQATDSDEEYDLEFVDEDEDDDEETDDSFSEGEESEGGSGPASNTRARAAAGFPRVTHYMDGRVAETGNEGAQQQNPVPSASDESDRAQKAESLERLRGILQNDVGWDSSQRHHLSSLIRTRECAGHWSPSKRTRVSSRVLPHGEPEVVDTGNSRAYIGHFAEEGNVFIAGFQNQTIRLYDVCQAHQPWQLRKEIVARSLNWTITDTCLSPNNQLLVYATISPTLHAVNINASDDVRSIQNITDVHIPLDFGEGFSDGSFGLWAINFSGDGKFILAGSSDYATYLYDVEAQRVVAKAHAHKDDVNTVCFMGDSGQVYLSGSDDCMIKVWDRRCDTRGEGLSRAQGILPGHTEGLTYMSPKGDGRYFISNGKDQKCKLWDIRAMYTSGTQMKKHRTPRFFWDYRWQPYPGNPNKVKHPNDRSIATFTGHRVLQTLIRCRWSPAETTGQRYIFSGSQCGSLFVYDVITGKKTAVFRFHRSVMRDCDWHPNQPLLASVGWEGSVVRWQKLPEDHREATRGRGAGDALWESAPGSD